MSVNVKKNVKERVLMSMYCTAKIYTEVNMLTS